MLYKEAERYLSKKERKRDSMLYKIISPININ